MKLPSMPIDGQSVVDASGTIYRYNSITNTWIASGVIINSGLVSQNQKGLISPIIAETLQILRSNQPQNFKILPNIQAYYYLIKGSDRFFVFDVEKTPGAAELRIELNRSAITNNIISHACPGKKGETGVIGATGYSGLSTPSEADLELTVDGTIATFNAVVPTPLSTEISIRLYQNETNKIEIWYNIITASWVTKLDLIGLDQVNIVYSNEQLTVSLKSRQNWGDNLIARARQRGPSGYDGENGEPFLVIDNKFADQVLSRSAVLVFSNIAEKFQMVSKPLMIDQLPVAHLRAYDLGPAQDIFSMSGSDIYATIGLANGTSKPIWKWVWDKTAQSGDDLSLPQWLPDPSCLGVQFAWGPSELKIIESVPLPKKCCQEDFYFCPNIWNVPGGTTGSGSWQPSSSS